MTAFDTESATGAAVSAADAARNNANTGDGKAECALSDEERFSRAKMLIGEDGIETLKKSRVAVFGIGGVGGFVVEALARAGIC